MVIYMNGNHLKIRIHYILYTLYYENIYSARDAVIIPYVLLLLQRNCNILS